LSLQKTSFGKGKTKDGRDTSYKEMMEIQSLPSCFGIGISTFDREFAGGSSNQVYRLEMLLDKKLFSLFTYDSIPFDKARYINCYTDLSPKLKSNKIQKYFRSKNEDLEMLITNNNNGEVVLMDTLIHRLDFIVYDFAGNKEEVTIYVQNKKSVASSAQINKQYDCLTALNLEKTDYKVTIPEKTFYNDFNLSVEVKKATGKSCSNILIVKGVSPPLFKGIDIGLKPIGVREDLIGKLFVTEAGAYCGGEYNNGFVVGKSKNLGSFTLAYDTVAPLIKPNKLSSGSIISFQVSDQLSGIDKFRMEINGKWVPSEYEHKKNTIFYLPDESLKKGKMEIVLKVWDKKGNLSTARVNRGS
ncbi:MAG TPA: hypothetical protein VNX68_02770, partial [Nitrosopumilaceae archaeon]|nr:hypothetical protein [Nitrosopumilaceae archaeon]